MSDQRLKLDANQRAAVNHGSGPLLIIAGAGTGKTTVVTQRIERIIVNQKVRPEEVLALTFTQKAAREMEERVDQLLPYGYTDMWISTFHSFCDRVLRRDGVEVGLNPAYRLMAQSEAIDFFRKNLFSFKLDYYRPLGNPNRFVQGLLTHFSRLADEDLTPADYQAWVTKNKSKLGSQEAKKYLELARVYAQYGQLKAKNDLLDFADLVSWTLNLFRERRSVLKRYQTQFKYLLVDEFQDTNRAQNKLAFLLAGKDGNITAVGDDDQCLPPEAEITLPSGKKKIKDIRPGEEIVSAAGKGYVWVSKVERVFKNEKKARFLTFKTKSGRRITVTDNHKMFCLVPPTVYGKKEFYYVYLMERKGLGWRIGTTCDLALRLKLERSADRIIGIKACKTEQEARYFETLFSLKYKIPRVCFKAREAIVVQGEWLEKLYREIDTAKNVEQLAKDLGIDLGSHHFCLGGVVRGDKTRVKVNLRICRRRYAPKRAKDRYLYNPGIRHLVNLETSDKVAIRKLKKAGIKLLSAKKGLRVRKSFLDLREAGEFADKLVRITDGILDVKFSVAKRSGYARQARVMPASNVLCGHYLPILKDYEVIYDQVVSVTSEIKKETVYDLEVEGSHNFIADGVVVHNSIYRFRGAAVANIQSFTKKYPKAKKIVLKNNYRSGQRILNRAYRLIQFNNPNRLEVQEKVNKHLVAQREIKGRVELLLANRVEEEATLVVEKIKSAQKRGYQWGQMAILVRANNHAEPFVRELSRQGVPYQFLGPGKLLRQEEVKDLIAYLKLLDNFEDDIACYRLLASELVGLEGRELATLVNAARREKISLFEASEQAASWRMSGAAREILKNWTGLVGRHLKLLPKETAGQVLYYYLQDSGYLKQLAQIKSVAAEKKALNVARFFDRLKKYETDHADASVASVVAWLNLAGELGESPLASGDDWFEENKVNLLTVHSSKGLEFPVVFLIDLVGARFPSRNRADLIPLPEGLLPQTDPSTNFHLQEERRLAYVGLTRGRDEVYLAAARFYAGAKQEKKLSPFVYEVFGEDRVEKALAQVKKEKKEVSLQGWEPIEDQVEVGDRSVPVEYLSFTQISTFETCPLQYRYKYRQKIPLPLSAPQSFGSNVHRALELWYQQALKGEKLQEKELLALFDQVWVGTGFTSREHEDKTRSAGKKMLREYCRQLYDEKKKVLGLEKLFSVKLAPGFKVGGKIDRIDQLAGSRVEIVDYKTGRVWDQKKVDDSVQMTLYALAATHSGSSLRLGYLPDQVSLAFVFLQENKVIKTTRTKDQLKQAQADLLAKKKEIEKSRFNPSPGRHCDFCEYKLICEAWE